MALDRERGETICTHCGLVTGKVLWDPVVYGGPLYTRRTHPRGRIHPLPYLVPPSPGKDFKGIFARDWILRGHEEMALKQSMAEIYRVSALLNLPRMLREYISSKLKSLPKKPGRTPHASRVAALVKISCEIHRFYVPIDEIVEAVNQYMVPTTKKLTLREYHELKTDFAKRIPDRRELRKNAVVDLIISSATSLGANNMVDEALKTYKQLCKSTRFRCKKVSMQVALVWRYLMSREKVKLKVGDIAKILGVHRFTLSPSNIRLDLDKTLKRSSETGSLLRSRPAQKLPVR